MRTINKILEPVNCQYGAPMGRANIDDRPAKNGLVLESYMKTHKLHDCKVPLTQGYDKGGAYWGNSRELRVKYTRDLLYIEFYRK